MRTGIGSEGAVHDSFLLLRDADFARVRTGYGALEAHNGVPTLMIDPASSVGYGASDPRDPSRGGVATRGYVAPASPPMSVVCH